MANPSAARGRRPDGRRRRWLPAHRPSDPRPTATRAHNLGITGPAEATPAHDTGPRLPRRLDARPETVPPRYWVRAYYPSNRRAPRREHARVTAASRTDPFTSAEALATLEEACLAVGLRHEGAELLRLGENAIFRLAHDPVVVRIARNLDVLADAEKEVAVARWLQDANLPATEPADYTQPIIARGRPVTFWK